MKQRFQDLLMEYSLRTTSDADQQEIEQVLWDEYGAEKAVFVLDMSGFSLMVQKYGVVHYLAMIRRMQLTVEPIINSYEGSVVKFEADNCFAVFDDVESAIQTGIRINNDLREENEETPNEFNIYVSCGIDYGKILMIGGKDFFGNAVNCASKLGEDLASQGEIYVTEKAMSNVEGGKFQSNPIDITISGIELKGHSIIY